MEKTHTKDSHITQIRRRIKHVGPRTDNKNKFPLFFKNFGKNTIEDKEISVISEDEDSKIATNSLSRTALQKESNLYFYFSLVETFKSLT